VLKNPKSLIIITLLFSITKKILKIIFLSFTVIKAFVLKGFGAEFLLFIKIIKSGLAAIFNIL